MIPRRRETTTSWLESVLEKEREPLLFFPFFRRKAVYSSNSSSCILASVPSLLHFAPRRAPGRLVVVLLTAVDDDDVLPSTLLLKLVVRLRLLRPRERDDKALVGSADRTGRRVEVLEDASGGSADDDVVREVAFDDGAGGDGYVWSSTRRREITGDGRSAGKEGIGESCSAPWRKRRKR
jgi:hypothetical protein